MSGLISVDEAHRLLAAHGLQAGVESVALTEAQHRTLAQAITARVSRPPNAVSAMDGYAVRLEDVREAGAVLKVIGEAPAGTPFSGVAGADEAVRVFTGGEIPEGTDHIVIQEDTVREGDTVTCLKAYDAPAHIRKAGLDFREGATVLDSGTRLGAGELALIASANHGTVPVRKRLRVGILANGNELKAPGSDLAPGEIVNSNPAGLAALIRDWGGEPVDLGIAEDSMESIRDSIQTAGHIDIFLPVGGASVGDHDLMRPAFAAEGFEPVFAKIAVKPGKPTWFSTRGKQLVLGLPGNPASALVCAHLFLQPLLHDRGLPYVPARLASPLAANGRREQYLRAEVFISEDGTLCTKPSDNQDSSLITPFIHAAALIRREAEAPAVAEGDTVELLLASQLDPATLCL